MDMLSVTCPYNQSYSVVSRLISVISARGFFVARDKARAEKALCVIIIFFPLCVARYLI